MLRKGKPMDISIIVPVYNGEKYLAPLLDDICAIQKFSLEVLLVDDGSTDRSRDLIEEYKKRDDRIQYFYKENGGIVSARNYGLERASGEYLFFSDQDDRLDAAVLEKAVERLKEHNADMLFFSTRCFTDGGKEWACDTVTEEGLYGEREIGDIFIRKLVTRYTEKEVISYIGHLWTVVVRRQLVTENHISFKRFIAIDDDLFFVLDCLDHAKRLLTLKETGYFWRQNPASRTRNHSHTKDQAQKMKNYYTYRTEVLLRHNICNTEDLERYYIGVKQEFMLNLLDNEAMPGAKIRKAAALLKNYLQKEDMQSAMRQVARCPLAKRYGMEKKLLARGHILLAIFYKKAKYAKAEIGKWIRRG